ncbi:FAD binding domain-containing protein [Nostoc linckia FACHB-104]|nr:FAD binding domain-containing protein [Nostoc linckia FACHB-104]
MLPVQFDYVAPESLDAAVKFLKDNAEALILAGSHSLIAEMKRGNVSPSLLVDLGKIISLRGINYPGNILQINAMTTYAQVAASREIQENYPALFEAVNNIGDAQIRNWQTIGDVFAYRDLACDFTAVALVLEASFNTIDTEGSHQIEAAPLIAKSFQSNWQSKAIVTSIDLPADASGKGSAYQAFKHPATGYTLCGIATAVAKINNGIVDKCRVAVTGVTPYAVRLTQVEAAIEGKAPTVENIAAASKLAKASVGSIVGDRYASAEYRAHIMEVNTKRTLTRALERSGIVFA